LAVGSGGIGLQSSITGSAIYYAAGGGGGALAYSGQGGVGGGGNGANINIAGSAGTNNTGGGGGGGGDTSGAGGAGGSGVVVLSIPTAFTVSTSGSPNIITNSQTLNAYNFWQSGTLTIT
jgi:hypothetical protein